MAVEFKVKFYWYHIGQREFLHALEMSKEVSCNVEIKSI